MIETDVWMVGSDLGVEAEVAAQSSPQDIMGNTVFCTSLAGEELGRIRTWGTVPRRRAGDTLASPSSICDMPQNLLEPILLGGWRSADSGGEETRLLGALARILGLN